MQTALFAYLEQRDAAPEALLQLLQQRWSIENEWHWVRDTQLGEDAHRYANRIRAPVFSFLQTVVMNLLRRSCYRAIRCGQLALVHDINGMLALGGVQLADNATRFNFQAALKPDVDHLRESPALHSTTELLVAGLDVLACEPNLSDHPTIKLHAFYLAGVKAHNHSVPPYT